MTVRRWLAFAVLAATWSGHAREVERYDEIERELAVASDVLGSALSNSFGERLRVTGLSADYLARQGVLVQLSLRPGWRATGPGGELEINTEIDSIAEIPIMVREIIEQLDIAIAPYSAEELENLRELREEQRDLRDERRDIHGRLRAQRRELTQVDGAAQERIEAEIATLENALRVIEEAEASVDADIDEHYDRLRNTPAPGGPAVSAAEVDGAIARAACDFGDTLRSLGSEQYLTFKVHHADATRYHAFKMDDVRACQRADIDAAKLMERAWSYPDR